MTYFLKYLFFIFSLYQVSLTFFLSLFIHVVNFFKRTENIKQVTILRTEPTLGDLVIGKFFVEEITNKFVGYKINIICCNLQFDLVKNIYIHPNISVYPIDFDMRKNGLLNLLISPFILFFLFVKKLNFLYSSTYLYFPRCDVDRYTPLLFGFFSLNTIKVKFSSKIFKNKNQSEFGFDFFASKNILLSNEELSMHEASKELILLDIFDKSLSFSAHSSKDNTDKEHQCIILVGASDEKRKWPIENYISLAEVLSNKYKIRCTFLFGRDEKIINKNALSNFSVIGPMDSIITYNDILPKFDLAIGNDSGLLHFASMFVAKTICISPHAKSFDPCHPNSPERFKPLSSDSVVIRPLHGLGECSSFCTSNKPHCICQLTVQDVLVEL